MKAASTLLLLGAIAILAAAIPASARLLPPDSVPRTEEEAAANGARPQDDSPQDDGGCDGITPRTLTYNSSSYSAAAFSSDLSQLRETMRANPACRVVVTGNGGGTKIEQQMSWMRVDAIITYMNDTYDISRDRFIFLAGQPGASNIVTLRPAAEGEDGPSSVPQPHPGIIR